MRTQSHPRSVEETTRTPRLSRSDAAVIAQYIRDLRQAS